MKYNSQNWKTVALGDVTRESTVRIGGLQTSIYGVDRHKGLVPESKYSSSSLERYKRIGPAMFAYNPMRLNIGSIGYCTEEMGAGGVSPDYIVFGCTDDLDPDFLSYIIKSPLWKEWAAGAGVGSVRVRIYYKEVSTFQFTLPPLSEQHVISRLFRGFDGKIQSNRRINEILSAILIKTFDRMFGDILVSEGSDAHNTIRFGQIASMSSESVHPPSYPEEMFAHYSIPAFDTRQVPEFEKGRQIKSNKAVVLPNSVLLSKLNPRIPRVWMPFPPNGVRSICSTEFLVLHSQEDWSREFLAGICTSDAFRGALVRMATGTSNSHQRVKLEHLQKLNLRRPAPSLVSEFTQLSKTIHANIAHNFQENAVLESLSRKLLPKVTSGEIRAKQIPHAAGASL